MVNGHEYGNAGCCVCTPKEKPNCQALGMRRGVDLSCRKKLIFRRPRIGECEAGFELGLGLCYRFCPRGYHGVGPVCWSQVPEVKDTTGVVHRWANCGAAAAKDRWTCAKVVSEQVWAVFSSIFSIVTFGLSSWASRGADTAKKMAQDATKYLKVAARLNKIEQVGGWVEAGIDCGLGITNSIGDQNPAEGLTSCAVAAFSATLSVLPDVAPDGALPKVLDDPDTKGFAEAKLAKQRPNLQRQLDEFDADLNDLENAKTVLNAEKLAGVNEARRLEIDEKLDEIKAKKIALVDDRKTVKKELGDLELDVKAYEVSDLEQKIAVAELPADAETLRKLEAAKEGYAELATEIDPTYDRDNVDLFRSHPVDRRKKLRNKARQVEYIRDVALDAAGEAGETVADRETYSVGGGACGVGGAGSAGRDG